MTLPDIIRIYEGSDGTATMALYDRLTKLGPIGEIAVNLFRAQKASARAKVYRGGIRGKGSYRGMAYERKQWAMENLAAILTLHQNATGIRWGWGEDDAEMYYPSVLYVDLPTGQVSFHTASRGGGPDYPGKWDGVHDASPGRICSWCAKLLTEKAAA